MERNEETTEKLIRYLDGQLPADERIVLEGLLNADKTLQQELVNLELAQQVVRSYGLRKQVAAVREKMLEQAGGEEKESAKIYPFVRRLMRYAAVLAFAFFSIAIYMYATTSSSQLYEDHYQQYRLDVARGDNKQSGIVLAFNEARYSDVITIFNKTTNLTNRDYFLVAQAYQIGRDYKNAINSYIRLINLQIGNNSFHDDAEYYLALTYLENQEPTNAKRIFSKIYDNPDHLYHSKVSFWMMVRLEILVIGAPDR